jgi:hypothetical protein
MTCRNQDDEVYLSLMNQRTQYDKDMIRQYNCINFVKTYPESLLSMVNPTQRARVSATQNIDLAVSYQLNPTAQTVKAAQGQSNTTNKAPYPPSCGFDKIDRSKMCSHMTPGPYANLNIAYNPTSGSSCINLGQDLNLYGMK